MSYPQIDPVLIHLGPLAIRWYGLMYVIGFVVAYFLMITVVRRKNYDLTREQVEDCLATCILGLILGGRLGYCLIYNLPYYLSHPLKIVAVWEGGMSFHGGMAGILLAGWWYARRNGKPFLLLADLGALGATPGLFFGRIGNFINGELYGRVTDVPWGMVFPTGGPDPRHPSQLYEATGEGLLLFVILYLLTRRRHEHGEIVASFLIFYGVIRFCLEFFRQPDRQMGFVLGSFSMGQMLCGAMIVCGALLYAWVLKSTGSRSDKS